MEMCDRRWVKCRAPRRKVGTTDNSDLSDLDDSLGLGWGEAGKPETWSPAPSPRPGRRAAAANGAYTR
jgi:hypothetical protein